MLYVTANSFVRWNIILLSVRNVNWKPVVIGYWVMIPLSLSSLSSQSREIMKYKSIVWYTSVITSKKTIGKRGTGISCGITIKEEKVRNCVESQEEN